MGIDQVIKRDGWRVPFDRKRIENAIYAAARAVGNGESRQWAETLSWAVTGILEERFGQEGRIPHVEEIQDVVEEVLIKSGHPQIAKAYILYRQKRAEARAAEQMLLDTTKLVDDYLDQTDWRVSENSNMNYSLQGLNFYLASSIAARYWLHKIYPPEVQQAHIEGDFHIHDLGMLSVYCTGWDLQDLLLRGFGGVPAKIASRPPRHLRTALGQLVNFFYTVQGEVAGAVAVSNLDTLLAPFIRYDRLDESGIRQAVQEFVFNINVPTRVGFQSLVWDELVVLRRAGRIEVTEIGRLVDEQFERNRHRVLNQGNHSYAVANADDIQALAFDSHGSVRWVRVKAFVRHRVPQGSTFVRMHTGRGTARVSQAHSMFAFAELNGHCNIRPIAAHEVDTAHGNAGLTPNNHLIAVRRAPNGGARDRLDLVDLIDAVPQVAERVRVRVADPDQAVETLREQARQRFGGLTAFYLEFGLKDRGCWKRWAANRSIPYRVWRALGQDESEAEFALRNSDLWYPRVLEGDRLRDFVRLLGWYIAEGHNDITNGLYVSQERGANQEEMERVLRALGALGRIEETRGWSAQGFDTPPAGATQPKGNPTQAVLRMAGKGLLAALIGYLGGTYSTNKVLPWFVYELTPDLQEELIATLLRGDGCEFPNYYDYTTTSKKLCLGLSLLLAMNGYQFSVYETGRERPTWSDQYTLRIYRNKDAPEGYAVGDLLARVCHRRETFVYAGEYEYDLSVDTPLENFAGGSGLLCFHNTPFTNITMDLTPPPTLRDQPVIIGGKPQEAAYGEFQREMDLLNRIFAEVMLEGDANARVFSFPIPTYNITRDFDWENPVLEPVWGMAAKYGIPYWGNYINSDLRPEDARSMCCRLRLDHRELRRRPGGLFAAAPLTGSVGVVTINLPRLAYLAEDEEDFRRRLERLMEIARTSLEIKRKVLEHLTERGLYPYSRHYLEAVQKQAGAYWSNHFSTIGLIGMNEACLNLLGVGIAHPEGKALAVRTLHFMRQVLSRFQEETGNLYNLEATPAEGASYRLARADRKRFPNIQTAGTPETPYYTNSTHLPVSYTDDLFEVLEHQDELQALYTGGTVLHIFLGERLDDWRQARKLVRTVTENYRLPYFTITPTFSICPVHGYIPGEHRYCPYEHTEEELARYGVRVQM
ncbi:MAG: ribonucleoside triphosphate reductase [Chloroflexia bacterium]